MTIEYRLFGPPGTGKTTQLGVQARKWAADYGADALVLGSFTRAAATEIASRDLPLARPREQIGTLHAFAFRAIGATRDSIAEPHARDFNDAHPAYRLSLDDRGSVDIDERVAEGSTGVTEGDKLLNRMEVLRARMTPRELWPPSVGGFARAWETWKQDAGHVDFTDLIEVALADADECPGFPVVACFDEVQDFTPLELALVRKWASRMDKVVLAGDDDQCIYCHPPWATVATTTRGSVRVDQLRPDDRVVGYDKRGGNSVRIRRRRGCAQRVGVSAFDGELIRVTTDGGETVDVTPGHRMVARWSTRPGAVLYLMLSGGHWRVGTTTLHPDSQGYCFGPAVRARQERADALWILDVFPTPGEARAAEQAASAIYKVPERPFRRPFGRYEMSQGMLDRYHDEATAAAHPLALLVAYRRDLEHPFWWRDSGRQYGCRAHADVRACNLVPGWMEVPTDTGAPKPKWREFTTTHAAYRGPVYSLAVDPYEHYIADGIVVHNSFKGATPDAFLDPPVDAEHKRVLSQSFRLPAAVHHVAQAWVTRLSRREPKQYAPRDDEGSVRILSHGSYRFPEPVLDDAVGRLDDGRTVMLLTTCSYMLDIVKARLRRDGVPFHNPYRRTRGDWNPLQVGSARRRTAADRLLAFLRPQPAAWGDQARWYTYNDLRAWVEHLAATRLLVRGAKTQLDLGEGSDEVRLDAFLAAFAEDQREAVFDACEAGDVGWLLDRLLASKRKPYDFPARVIEARGAQALRERPRLVIGTIHSVKGGEADVVYLFPDLSTPGMRQWTSTLETARDEVIRQMYVGMTRAREELVICQRATPYGIEPELLVA